MIKREYFFFLLVLVLFLPVLLFGGPGYYGDDLNFIESIHQNGAFSGIHNWLSHYGLFYRPLGVTFLYLIYAILGFSESLVYFSSYAIYFFFIFYLFKCLQLITKNIFFTFFVTFFVALFPLAPTVFFQISSAYQALTAGLVVILISLFYLHRHTLTNKKLAFFSLAWFILLLTYEQITGLIVIFGLIAVNANWPLKNALAKKQILKVVFTFSSVTILFAVIYVTAAGNPKIVTLINLNNIDSPTTQIANPTSSAAISPMPLAASSRAGALFQKISKVFSFLASNIVYSICSLKTTGWKGLIITLPIATMVFLVFFIPLTQPSFKFCVACIIIGLAWFSSTIAPFLLYKAVHLPPYVLLIPSVGLAVLTYGLFWIICPKSYYSYSKIIFKCIFALIVLVFPLQQYGYFFGLKEELSYWRTIESKVSDEKPKILEGGVVELANITPKHNEHIFWLEEAIGKKYFKMLMGEQFTNLALEYTDNKTALKMYLKDPNI